MPNVKFDGTNTAALASHRQPALFLFRPKTPFIILGSVRKEEESQVLKLAESLKKERPKTVIGLFPRHMHRIDAWEKMLEDAGLPWVLRSEIENTVPFGHIVLWDVFGEMQSAFSLARAAFIGGSLAPVGGQNFLEPLAYGDPGYRPLLVQLPRSRSAMKFSRRNWPVRSRIGKVFLKAFSILANGPSNPKKLRKILKNISQTCAAEPKLFAKLLNVICRFESIFNK
ncbi:3-deoxy-D-manno-octulosonic acid transferase [Maridesulfovibrio sp.]|uniref:3-deoxy-D-manno-octulosonic acid transferase n=1 Tax=Maridesulfovibrio sp. TaxID=2795000 RepID=UPI003B00C5BC